MSNPTQVEFERADAGRSQHERLRDYLFKNPNHWVPMVELGRVIRAWAVHSRANDCRRLYGMHITARKHTNPHTGETQDCYLYNPDLPGNFGCQRNKREEATA